MPDQDNRIIIDPKILVGKPVIRGTRLRAPEIVTAFIMRVLSLSRSTGPGNLTVARERVLRDVPLP